MIKLGDIRRDSATEMSGRVNVIAYRLGNSTAYCLQPATVDEHGAPAGGTVFPHDRIAATGDIDPRTHPCLGKKVKHPFTDAKGTVIEYQDHIAGCAIAVVQSPGLSGKTGQPYYPWRMDASQLMLDEDPAKPLTSLLAATTPKPTGPAFDGATGV